MTAGLEGYDSARLESSLASELEADVVGTRLLQDGLNRSIAVSTPDEDPAFVLRQRRKLRDAGYIIDLDDEYAVLEGLLETPVPAPEPLLFCGDESILGGRFFLMTALDGESVPLGSRLPERFQTPAARRRVANLLVDTLADIHSLDVEAFGNPCEHVTPRDQLERSVDRLDVAAAETELDLSALREVAAWLRENAPTGVRTTLVHGDYRPGNVLFDGTTRPEVGGVIDWETALLGDPLTEVGYLLLRWRDEGDPTPDLDELEARYPDSDAVAELQAANERGLAPFTSAPGSPSRRELVARYEEQTGFSFDDWRFYLGLAAFMLATVWVDLHRHDVTAGASSDREPYIEYVTMLAESIVDGAFDL